MKLPPVLSTLTLTLALASAPAGAAQASLDLPSAVRQALQSGPDVRTAQANLDKAQANLRARQADPTTLVLDLTAAQQQFASAQAALGGAKLSVMQTVVNQYTALYEAQEQVQLGGAKVGLAERNLKIAQARLSARNATQLDVNRAQNTLATNRQDLANARAQLPVLSGQLGKTLGVPAGSSLTVVAPPAPPRQSVSGNSANADLSALPTVLTPSQAVQTAQLQVKLAQNDFTPRRTLEDAQVSLSNAQRDLDSARRSAQNSLRDAARAVQDAAERVALARQALANQETGLKQAQARFSGGTASAVDVQSAQVDLASARFSLTQATDTLWRALATLSAASGRDVTGLTGGGA